MTNLRMEASPTDWYDGVQARGELASERLRVAVESMPGVHRFTCELGGIPGRVTVFARSPDLLARRIEWITGRACADLRLDMPRFPVPMVRQIEDRPALPATDDRYAGRITIEGARTCGACENYTAGHTCRNQAASGLASPNAGNARRCLGFAPKFDATDRRTGVQLWPELIENTAAVAESTM